MTQPSVLYQLIEARLGEPLADFVAARRRPTKSWREIAEEIDQKTGQRISDETIRLWFVERDRANAA